MTAEPARGDRGDRGTGAPLRLTVPMPPPLTNASGRSRRWWAVEKAKKAYWRQLDTLQQAGVIPAPPPGAPFPRAGLRSVMRLGNAMDTDNAVARHKWILDWLRTRGYIEEDRRDILVWESFPEQIVKRGQRYSVVLTLTPLPLTEEERARRTRTERDRARRAIRALGGRGAPRVGSGKVRTRSFRLPEQGQGTEDTQTTRGGGDDA